MERCVVITGAAGGIGKSLVTAFARAGYYTIGLDIADSFGSVSGTHIKADLDCLVEDEKYAAETIGAVKAAAAGKAISALVNNAAVQILNTVDHLSRAEWRRSLNVSLQAPFFLAQALLPDLAMSKGSIINISSIHARLTKPTFAAYATSKAALSGMTRAMAVELGGRVRVNAIEPAAIETEMLRAGFERDLARYEQLRRFHPAKSIAAPDELAALVVHLVKTDSPFQTGSIVAFDGAIGSLLHGPDL